MDSLKEKRIITDPVAINMNGCRFEITEDYIIRNGLKEHDISPGFLVKTHFDNVYEVLELAKLLKETGVREAIAMYWMGEEEKKKYEEAPTLEKCLDDLEKQLSLLTDGEYDEYYKDCQKRHNGGEGNGEFNLPFEMQMQDIFWDIIDLREGRYHNSGNPRYKGRRGIPRIETIGERMYAKLLDLIWALDREPRCQEG